APCVSIYLPTHNAGMEVNDQEDKRSFKAALRKVQQSLIQQKFDASLAGQLLIPGLQLLNDDDFWRNQSSGLAVFLSPGYSVCCQLPRSPGEKIHINTSFLLSPLATMLTDTDYAYLLVLSKHAARIYRADRFTLSRIDVPEMPKGMDDVIHFEEKGGDSLLRSADGGHGGGGHTPGTGTNFHGVGSGKPDEKTNIAIYLKEVDKTLRSGLGIGSAPLFLAGVEYLLPIFRSVSGHRNIADQYITGNYDRIDDSTLYQHARPILASYFDKQQQESMTNLLDHTSRVNSFPQEVIRAAFEGRVAELYVIKGTEVWGRYEPSVSEPVLHEQEEKGDENLADQALIQTVLHGGKAHVVENMPMTGKLAAVMRY
ncbi:MAG: hypothetical protein JST42_04575, partial [Bacteroidetes bacterium]|nr:hypothetical protein [Bacteroidota bacterium]